MAVPLKAEEKRTSLRRQTLMEAHILDPQLGMLTKCTVRDFSSGGARVEVEHGVNLPSVFWLKIHGDGPLRYCTPKWRSKHAIGVEFTRDKLLQIAEGELSALRRLLSWSDGIPPPQRV